MGEVIRAADDHVHPIAVHKLHGPSFEEFADDPDIDQFAIQWNKHTADELHDGVVTAWKKANGRYNLIMAEAKGRLANATAKNWACAMGGAYVMVLEMDISSTSPELLKRCRILQQFF